MKNKNMFFYFIPGLDTKKNLFELFDIFVGITEDKYNTKIEEVNSPAFLLRLSSINEFDNTIKHRDELIEIEKKIDLFRSRREMRFRPDIEKMNIPNRFLLRESDYIITNRGNTRIISMRKAMELDTQVEHFVATQQFIYLRPKENTENYDIKYIDIIIEALARKLRKKQDNSNISNVILKEGHTLKFKKFEVGEKVTIINKNGGLMKIEDGKHFALILDKDKESKISFKIKNEVIEEITKSLMNIVTVKELEKIEFNISENLYEQQKLVAEYEKVFFGLENAKLEFERFTEEVNEKFFAKN
jgi:hypothetical protein